jgi:lysozyme
MASEETSASTSQKNFLQTIAPALAVLSALISAIIGGYVTFHTKDMEGKAQAAVARTQQDAEKAIAEQNAGAQQAISDKRNDAEQRISDKQRDTERYISDTKTLTDAKIAELREKTASAIAEQENSVQKGELFAKLITDLTSEDAHKSSVALLVLWQVYPSKDFVIATALAVNNEDIIPTLRLLGADPTGRQILERYENIGTPQQKAAAHAALSAPEAVLKLLPSGTVSGFALSHFNQNFDLSQAKERGARFVYIKVSQGTSIKDKAAEQYVNTASADGLPIGLYHFYTPQDDPDAQADNFLAELKKRRWELPPMIDCEEFLGSIPDDYADRVYKFASKIREATKVQPVIYTITPFAEKHLDRRFHLFPVAIARFSTESKPNLPEWWSNFLFWHYNDGSEGELLPRIVFNGNAELFTRLLQQTRASSKPQ